MSGLRRHCVLFDLDGTLVDTAPDLTAEKTSEKKLWEPLGNKRKPTTRYEQT